MKARRFHLSHDHLVLLKRANIQPSNCEWGSPGLDCKRPFGNSDMVGDVADILGWEMVQTDDGEVLPRGSRAKAQELLSELADALEIVLTLQTFEPGIYERVDWLDWRRSRAD